MSGLGTIKYDLGQRLSTISYRTAEQKGGPILTDRQNGPGSCGSFSRRADLVHGCTDIPIWEGGGGWREDRVNMGKTHRATKQKHNMSPLILKKKDLWYLVG